MSQTCGRRSRGWGSRTPETITNVTAHIADTEHLLQIAAQIAGVDTDGATIIRDGSHAMYRLPHGVVARIGRPGTLETAEREVELSDWLASCGITVTQTIGRLPQAVVVDNRPVTWWRLLPDHRAATPAELGSVLRALHGLPVPQQPRLPAADPFAGMEQRLAEPADISTADRAWLGEHLSALRDRYQELRFDTEKHVIHGDAWQGNVAVSATGTLILLDLEHVAVGPADWDLIPMAVDYTDFARLDRDDYRSFVEAYGGHDVTASSNFRTLADIQELRWVCFVISKSRSSVRAKSEVGHRIACLRGEIPRPWSWTAF